MWRIWDYKSENVISPLGITEADGEETRRLLKHQVCYGMLRNTQSDLAPDPDRCRNQNRRSQACLWRSRRLVSAILYLFLTVNFGCHTRSLEGLKKEGRMEGRVQLQKILSLFISVISRLWWFSSTKLQQHRKHEHKSAQITDCLSLYGRTERIKSIDEKIIHEAKKKKPKLRTWWRWDWCSGGVSDLYVYSALRLSTQRTAQWPADPGHR